MACISYSAFFIGYLQILEYLVSAVQIVTGKETIIFFSIFLDLVAIILIYKLSWVSVSIEEDII
jgi:hypothetical protein